MVEPRVAMAMVIESLANGPSPDMLTSLRSYAREYRDGGYADANKERVRSGQARVVKQSLLLIPDETER